MMFSVTSFGDLRVIEINSSSLPYDLRPDYLYNQSSYYYNQSSYSYNGRDGTRRLLTENDTYIGYYVPRDDGHINYFFSNGKRFGYTPQGGHTQSIFSDGAWCGTIGEIDGERVLGLKSTCYEKLTKVVREEQEASKEFCLQTYEMYKRYKTAENPEGADGLRGILLDFDCVSLLSGD